MHRPNLEVETVVSGYDLRDPFQEETTDRCDVFLCERSDRYTVTNGKDRRESTSGSLGSRCRVEKVQDSSNVRSQEETGVVVSHQS